jgi:hypothetical protein
MHKLIEVCAPCRPQYGGKGRRKGALDGVNTDETCRDDNGRVTYPEAVGDGEVARVVVGVGVLWGGYGDSDAGECGKRGGTGAGGWVLPVGM